jgi:hypothetical protein
MSTASLVMLVDFVGQVKTAYVHDGGAIVVTHGIVESLDIENERLIVKMRVLDSKRAFSIDGKVDLAINRIPREQANELVSNAIELGMVLDKLGHVITREFIRKLADGQNPILLIEQALSKQEEHNGNPNQHGKSQMRSTRL